MKEGKGKKKKNGNEKINGNDQKALKKQAEKFADEGVKYLEKLEGEEEGEEGNLEKKLNYYSLAHEKFHRALQLLPSHPESLYYLSLLQLEYLKFPIHEKNEEEKKTEMILNIENLLSQIILRDTSRRGLITGLAHRVLANLYLQYATDFLPTNNQTTFISLFHKSRINIERTQEILSNDSELDLYLFEYCECLNSYWEIWSQHLSLQNQNEITMIQDYFLFFKHTIESSLSCPCSSGIDRDIYHLYGIFLNNFIDFITTTKNKIPPPIVDSLKSDLFLDFINETILPTSKSLLGSLSFFGNYSQDLFVCNGANLSDSLDNLRNQSRESFENIESLSLVGNILRSLLELWEWKTGVLAISSGSSTATPILPPLDQENLFENTLRLIHLRLYLQLISRVHDISPEVLFSNLCSLGEDFMYLSSLLSRYQTELDFTLFYQSILQQILPLVCCEQTHEESFPSSSPPITLTNLTTFPDLISRLLEYSRVSFDSALVLFESQNQQKHDHDELKKSNEDSHKGEEEEEGEGEEEEGIAHSDYSTLLYNLVCVNWKLQQYSECENYLRKYFQSLLNERNCESREVLNEVTKEIQDDEDVTGLIDSELFEQIRRELTDNMPELSS